MYLHITSFFAGIQFTKRRKAIKNEERTLFFEQYASIANANIPKTGLLMYWMTVQPD